MGNYFPSVPELERVWKNAANIESIYTKAGNAESKTQSQSKLNIKMNQTK